MSSLTQIRTALTSTIMSGVPSINGYSTMPETINTPAFVVIPDPNPSIEYQAMGRGVDKFHLFILVMVSPRDNGLAQADLDPFLSSFGASSIRQAVFNARTLGLADADANVTGVSNYGEAFPLNGIDYVGARLSVEVTASGIA